MNELRAAINAVRAAIGLPNATLTDTISAGVTIKAIHITELRSSLDAARAALGLSAIAYTDPSLTAGVTTAKAAHIQELRSGVQ